MSAPRHLIAPWAFVLIAVLGVGAWAVQRQLNRPPAPVATRKPPPAPDHRALIADRSPAVLERGKALYAANCAACHGPAGDTNPANLSPTPRNFHREAMKNPLGSGPYAWYEVLSKGYGTGMPGFRTLPPTDRYAIVHFVRENWVKPTPALYVDDAPAVTAQIPAAGSAEAVVDLDKVAPPAAVVPTMAFLAAKAQATSTATAAWLARARAAAPGDALVALAAERAASHPGTAARWLALASRRDAAGLAAALVAADGGIAPAPALVLAPADELARVAGRLIAAVAP
jgi:high-affinity iron transporter